MIRLVVAKLLQGSAHCSGKSGLRSSKQLELTHIQFLFGLLQGKVPASVQPGGIHVGRYI
jgi:hypothetical protein